MKNMTAAQRTRFLRNHKKIKVHLGGSDYFTGPMSKIGSELENVACQYGLIDDHYLDVHPEVDCDIQWGDYGCIDYSLVGWRPKTPEEIAVDEKNAAKVKTARKKLAEKKKEAEIAELKKLAKKHPEVLDTL